MFSVHLRGGLSIMNTVWALVPVLFLALCHCQSSTSHLPGEPISDTEWETDFRTQFEDSDAFEKFTNLRQKGLHSKEKVFNLRDPAIREETKAFVELLISAKHAKTFTEIPSRMIGEINAELIYYALAVSMINWKGDILGELPYAEKNVNLPEWHDILSNYFVPKYLIDELNESLKKNRPVMSQQLLIPRPDDWVSYMTTDPVLNSMHYNWHIVYPTWAVPNKFVMTDAKNRGQIYYDFYSQLLANYFMKLTTFEPQSLCSWRANSTIKQGYQSELTNLNRQPIASRSPNSPMPENELLGLLREIENKLEESRVRANSSSIYVNDTYLYSLSDQPEKVREVLSNLIFNTTESLNPKYYGSYYDTAVNYLTSIGSDPEKDGGGAAGYLLTALRDPAYYSFMECVISPVKAIQYTISGAYSRDDLTVEDLAIDSVGVNRLETFFEIFQIDLMGPAKPKMYPLDTLRLNHKPFAFKLKLTNSGVRTRQAVVTIVLMRSRTEQRWDPVMNQYQIMDRFLAEVGPGDKFIERSFNESLVFTDENISALRCGIPKNLALPKGEPDGLNLTLLAFLSPFDPSKQEPADPEAERPHGLRVSPLCGNTRLNYGRSFGFPLDKPFPSDVNYGSAEVTVYHEVREFRGGVRI